MLFALFCLFAILVAVLEVWLTVMLVRGGMTEIGLVVSILSGTVLLGVGSLFVRLIRMTFIESPVISPSVLASFDSDRNRIVDGLEAPRLHAYDGRRHLVTSTLRFAESRMRGWLTGTHFELSVFLDPNEPLLFAYYDSSGSERARSMNERSADPLFYVRHSYEVVSLLAKPTSYPRILRDTREPDATYAFTSPEQREQVRSTVLICLDLKRPCGLVVTSNRKGAFDIADEEAMAFLRFVGSLVRYDLFEGEFAQRLRVDHPTLFSNSEGGASASAS